MPPGIIAFSKDWDDDPTSNHHVLRELAKSRRVLWLNSVAARTPSLRSAQDRSRIVRKLASFWSRPVNVENDLWVFTPLVLPFPYSRIARRINTLLLGAMVALLRRRLGMSEVQLWTFLPSVADYLRTDGSSVTVYYCVDEFSLFSEMDAQEVLAAEAELLGLVDCTFAVNHALAESKRALNPETHLALHGVDHALFSTALSEDTVVPDDIASLPRPVLGFYGSLRDWVDLDLVADVARLRPDWTIVLIGPVAVSVDEVAQLPNVRILGRRPHTSLPAYCKGFDVGLIPYRINERTPFVNPTKLREYLSAGLPVVSTRIDEVARYEDHCLLADDAEGFVAAVELAMGSDDPQARAARARRMETETWQARVEEISSIVDAMSARRRRR